MAQQWLTHKLELEAMTDDWPIPDTQAKEPVAKVLPMTNLLQEEHQSLDLVSMELKADLDKLALEHHQELEDLQFLEAAQLLVDLPIFLELEELHQFHLQDIKQEQEPQVLEFQTLELLEEQHLQLQAYQVLELELEVLEVLHINNLEQELDLVQDQMSNQDINHQQDTNQLQDINQVLDLAQEQV